MIEIIFYLWLLLTGGLVLMLIFLGRMYQNSFAPTWRQPLFEDVAHTYYAIAYEAAVAFGVVLATGAEARSPIVVVGLLSLSGRVVQIVVIVRKYFKLTQKVQK